MLPSRLLAPASALLGAGLLAATLLPAQTTVDNATTATLGAFDTTGHDLTLSGAAAGTASGVISGSGSLTKSSDGTWTLSANNTLTGTTTVSGGTLTFTGSGGLASSAVTVNTGATLSAGNFGSYHIGSIAGTGAVSFSFGTLYAGANNASTTFSGSIAGNGTLVKTGSGTLTFNGSAPAGSQLAVNGGTLHFAPSPAASFTASVLVQSGGTAIIAPPDPSRFTRHVTVYSGGSATLALPNSTPLGTTAINVNSGGAFTLGETYKTTALSNTTLAVSSGASLSLPGEGVVLGGLDNFGGGTVTFTPTGSWFVPNLTIGANNLSSAFGGTLAFTGATFGFYIRKIGTGTWTLLSTPNFAPIVQDGYVALSTASAGTGIQLQGGGVRYDTAMTHTGGISGQAGGGTIDLGSNAVTLSGTLSGGSASAADTLRKIGSGTLTLTGSSTAFQGLLAIDAGTVVAAANNALGTTAAGTTVAAGATLGLSGGFNYTTAESVTLSGTGAAGRNGALDNLSGNNAFAGTLILAADTQAGAASGTTLTLSGGISETGGSRALTFAGAGTTVLTGAGAHTGGTTIASGIVTVDTGGTLSAAAAPLAFTGGTLNLNVSQTVSQLSGATGTLHLGGGHTLTVNQSASSSFTGTLAGAGGLTKSGAGTLTLQAVAFAGPLAVSAGRLDVSGTVGALSINSGGTLSPGNSPGTLASTGTATFASGGSLLWEINRATGGTAGADPGWDLISISGALAITATSAAPFTLHLTSLTLANAPGLATNFDPAQNYTFNVVTATGGISGFNTNAFTLDTSAFANATQGGTWALSSSANTLALTFTAASAIPEPSTYAALAGLAALAFAAHRRRQRR